MKKLLIVLGIILFIFLIVFILMKAFNPPEDKKQEKNAENEITNNTNEDYAKRNAEENLFLADKVNDLFAAVCFPLVFSFEITR